MNQERNTIPVEITYLDPRFHSDAEEHKNFVKLQYGTQGAAAVDMIACLDRPVVLKPGERLLVSSGIKMWLDDINVEASILPRSGIGAKHGIVLSNLMGLIDSDYQGEMGIPLWNANSPVIWDQGSGQPRYNKEAEFTIYPGDRICQMKLSSVIHADFTEVTEFSGKTERGEGGFGHTGKYSDKSTHGTSTAETKYVVQSVLEPRILREEEFPHGVNSVMVTRIQASELETRIPVWFEVFTHPACHKVTAGDEFTLHHMLDPKFDDQLVFTNKALTVYVATPEHSHRIIQTDTTTGEITYQIAGTNVAHRATEFNLWGTISDEFKLRNNLYFDVVESDAPYPYAQINVRDWPLGRNESHGTVTMV